MLSAQKISRTFHLISAGFDKYRNRFIFIIIFGVLAGLFEGVGIGAIIPLFSIIIDNGLEIGQLDFITRSIGSLFSFFNIPLSPLFLILFIIFLFILKAIIKFFAEYINGGTVAEFQEETRIKILERSVNSSWPHLLSQKGGHLESLLIYDTEKAGHIFGLTSSFILLFTGFAMFAFVAFNISVKLTLLTVGVGIIFFFFFKPIFYKIRKTSEKFSSFQKIVSHSSVETILGAKMIKAFSVEKKVLKKVSEYFHELKRLKMRTLVLNLSSSSLIEPSILIIITLLFVASYRSPDFNIASFIVIIYLIRRMFSFVQSMQTHVQTINEYAPYLQNIMEYNRETLRNKEVDKGMDTFSFNNFVEFRDVSFSYDTRKETLRDVSFKINRGEMVGIVGPSGSGKTTIVDLILRLFNPEKGYISADNKNVSEISISEWRKNIGYVPQDIFLVHDTIANNIKFYEDIPKNEIERSSKMASIYNTIMELPDKFETVVGERGVKLSGGQRQRVALARALARKPQILILDEATSAIDTESEKLIQESIRELRGKITIIIIAHRPSTVSDCDRIFVLDKGMLAEEGRPEELQNNPESYFNKMN